MNTEKIARYLSNEMNESERNDFLENLKDNSGLRDELDKYSLIWNEVTSKKVNVDVDRAWNNVFEKIETPTRNIYKFLVAASIIVALCLSYFLEFNSNPFKEIQSLDKPRQITLADGSIIKLNKNSSVKYFTSLNDSVRFVYLKGEAYFDVEKNKRPFIVKTEQTTVKVLGTRFTVKETKNKTVLTVEEGKVAFNANKKAKKQILTAGKRSYCVDGEKLLPIELIDTSFMWYQESIFFDNKPLKEVCKILSNGFNVSISLKDTLSDEIRVTARFSKGQTIHTILKAIKQMYELNITELNDSTYVIGEQSSI